MLTDFGLGRSIDFEQDNALIGKKMFMERLPMAPEQILKQTLSFGPWTDLYAVDAWPGAGRWQASLFGSDL